MKFLFFFLSFNILSASDVSIAQSDFVERFVNFVIFFSILWYLGADKIKNIFLHRSQSIAKKFEKMQEEEQSIQQQVLQAEVALKDAKAKSDGILTDARKEAMLIAQQFDLRLEQDIAMMNRSFEETLKQEKIKILKDEVSYALDSVSAGMHLSDELCMKILTKGVGQ